MKTTVERKKAKATASIFGGPRPPNDMATAIEPAKEAKINDQSPSNLQTTDIPTLIPGDKQVGVKPALKLTEPKKRNRTVQKLLIFLKHHSPAEKQQPADVPATAACPSVITGDETQNQAALLNMKGGKLAQTNLTLPQPTAEVHKEYHDHVAAAKKVTEESKEEMRSKLIVDIHSPFRPGYKASEYIKSPKQ